MKPYATLEDLEARWKPLSIAEKGRAEKKLSDASVIVARECRRCGAVIDETDELAMADIGMIVCEMVKRAMLASVDQAPVSSLGTTTGPFSEQQTFVNPMGDLYMTGVEKRRLGITGQRIGMIAPKIGSGV